MENSTTHNLFCKRTSAIWAILIAGVMVFATQGCTVNAIIIPSPPIKALTSFDEGEKAKILDARDILPPELLKSEFHTVLDEVIPFRQTNYFSITSPYGQFDAYGEAMLRIRIHEIQGLAKIDAMNKYDTLARGAQNAILSPFNFVLDVLRNPAEAVLAIPRGLWRYATRIHEMATGERGELEEDETKELVGFSMVKREIADRLGVDVYSSNRTLQRKLNRLSWAGYAGDTGVRLLTIPITGPAGFVLTGTSWSNTLGQLFRDQAPEDLRRMNREKLEEMGISESMIDEFLRHPWYSPRHETLLVQALSEMTEVKKREAFVQVALSAEFEEEAFFFQRLATMMAAYHHHIEPLNEIVTIDNRLVMGHTKDHTLVVMFPVSRLSWGSEMAIATESVQTWKSNEHLIDNIVVWTSGTLTPQAAKHFSAKGLVVHEQAMEKIRWAKNLQTQETTPSVVASRHATTTLPDEDITW